MKFRSLTLAALLMLPLSALYLPVTPPLMAQQVQSTKQVDVGAVKKIAQSITVKVISGNDAGSGVLIKNQGQVYTVLTNSHVINSGQAITVKTPDGKVHKATLVNKINFKGKDAALLEFRASEKYAIAKLGNLSTIALNESVFAGGYPYDTGEFFFIEGKLGLILPQALKQGYQIGYTNPVEKGMSGGPILNAAGVVIGINGILAEAPFGNPYEYENGNQAPTQAEQDLIRRYNWGVPLQSLSQFAPEYIALKPSVINSNTANNTASVVLQDVENIATAITVRIEMTSEGRHGSGVIIAHQGNSYYVITAEHVVRQKKETPMVLEVITADGERYRVDNTTVKDVPGADLAVLQFTSNKSYQVATLAKHKLEQEGGYIFIAGFPSDNPTKLVLTDGRLFKEKEKSLKVQDYLSLSYGYGLVYTNLSSPGMSGGPVLDVRGHLVGIHGRAEGQAKIEQGSSNTKSIQLGYSLGVPSGTFLNFLNKVGIESQWLNLYTQAPPELTYTEIDAIDAALPKLERPTNSNDPIAWLNYGNQQWRRGKYEEALAAFEEAIRINPSLYMAWYAKGQALFDQEKLEEALTAFERAIKESNGQFAQAWGKHGIVLVHLAINNPEGVVTGQKLSDDARRQYEQALQDLNKAIALDNQEFSFYFYRGFAYDDLGHHKQAIEDFTKAIELNPQDAYAYYNRGVVQGNLGNNKQAIEDYTKAIELNPQYAYAYYNRGVVQGNLGNNKQAIEDYTKAIELNPQFADAYYGRGYAQGNLGNYKQAIEDYTKAIELNPQFADAYYGRGVAHGNLGNYKQAIEDYTKAIELNPQFADAYYSRGVAQGNLGNYKQAIEDYDKAIELNPQYADAYNNRGVAQGNLGNYKQAIEDYTKAIELNPQDADAYLGRGYAHGNLGNYKQAIEDYNKAIELNPQYAYAYNNRGVAQVNLGNNKQAIEDYTKAIELNPQYALAYYNRGVAYRKLGNNEKATEDYNKAIELDPQLVNR